MRTGYRIVSNDYLHDNDHPIIMKYHEAIMLLVQLSDGVLTEYSLEPDEYMCITGFQVIKDETGIIFRGRTSR